MDKVNVYKDFTREQLVNMAFYIAGIVFYKFSLETLNTCIFNLMVRADPGSKYLSLLWTVLQSINYATQCLGSLAVAPLIRRIRTNYVQAAAVGLFGLVIAIIPIMEVCTGGTLTQKGEWSQYILFAIFPIVGFFHGIIELIRRVIPSNIVGENEANLKRMDSSVHILYEVAGTAGALLARYWIDYFKYAYALFLIPISFTIAAVFWTFVRIPPPSEAHGNAEAEKELGIVENEGGSKKSFLQDLRDIFVSYFYAVYVGGKLIFGNRSLIWLLPAYTLPLVLHRYIENTLFPWYATFVLKSPSLSQTLLGGSNLGELVGAAFVLFFANQVKTPLPWLRSDAFTLSIIWILPYAVPYENVEAWAWALFPAMMFLSMGWASGDVSLTAYVQSRLSAIETKVKKVSPLGAVMAFLYVSYIILFPILASGMGFVMDYYRGIGDPKGAFVYVAGVFLTVMGVLIFLSTFIPKGSFAFNPDPAEEDKVSLGDDSNSGSKQEIGN